VRIDIIRSERRESHRSHARRSFLTQASIMLNEAIESPCGQDVSHRPKSFSRGVGSCILPFTLSDDSKLG